MSDRRLGLLPAGLTSSNPVVPAQALSITIPTPSPSPATSDVELAVVVPPTPSAQLLPLSETDGLTAGAVQPPGSTGREHRQEVRVSISDSDTHTERSSLQFDDEPPVLDEWEDDEQRLIRQGGNGIPIGLVGPVRSLLRPLSHRCL